MTACFHSCSSRRWGKLLSAIVSSQKSHKSKVYLWLSNERRKLDYIKKKQLLNTGLKPTTLTGKKSLLFDHTTLFIHPKLSKTSFLVHESDLILFQRLGESSLFFPKQSDNIVSSQWDSLIKYSGPSFGKQRIIWRLQLLMFQHLWKRVVQYVLLF